jgi:hypothetical protein
MEASALGLVVGYGATRITAGFVQLTSELLLSPVTTSVAEILPNEAFSAALESASKRSGEADSSAPTSSSGFAR